MSRSSNTSIPLKNSFKEFNNQSYHFVLIVFIIITILFIIPIWKILTKPFSLKLRGSGVLELF